MSELWQTSFREAGILQYALQSLESDATTTAIRKQYLRVIGNSVSDNGTAFEICPEAFLEYTSANILLRRESRNRYC